MPMATFSGTSMHSSGIENYDLNLYLEESHVPCAQHQQNAALRCDPAMQHSKNSELSHEVKSLTMPQCISESSRTVINIRIEVNRTIIRKRGIVKFIVYHGSHISLGIAAPLSHSAEFKFNVFVNRKLS